MYYAKYYKLQKIHLRKTTTTSVSQRIGHLQAIVFISGDFNPQLHTVDSLFYNLHLYEMLRRIFVQL